MSNPAFTSVRLRADAVEKLRRLTRLVSVELDRDATQSEVLEAIAEHGLEHVAEIAGRLRDQGSSNDRSDV